MEDAVGVDALVIAVVSVIVVVVEEVAEAEEVVVTVEVDALDAASAVAVAVVEGAEADVSMSRIRRPFHHYRRHQRMCNRTSLVGTRVKNASRGYFYRLFATAGHKNG